LTHVFEIVTVGLYFLQLIPHAIVSLNSGSMEYVRCIAACVCWQPGKIINKWQYQMICSNHIGPHQRRLQHGSLSVGG